MTKCKGKRYLFLCKETNCRIICKSDLWSALVDVRKNAVWDALAIPLPGQAILLLTMVFITSLSMNKQADEIDHVEIG